MTEHPDYALCGWRVRSALPLPELSPWRGDAREPDVVFAFADFPASLDAVVVHTPIVQIERGGRALITIDGVCDYLVEGGRSIRLMPHLSADAPDIRLFLLGAGFGILCHQRGVVPVHAATVEIDGEAVMMTGASGTGKSTLAAAFLRHGYRVLSDDIAPLMRSADGVRVMPAVRRIRLWEDSAEAARWDIPALERSRVSLAKFDLAIAEGEHQAPLVPRAVIHLGRCLKGEFHCSALRGVAAMQAMRRQTYRWRALVGLEGAAAAYARVSEAAAHIPLHFDFARPMDYASLDRTVETIVGIARSGECPG
jgi:hypothetical protein